MRRSKRRLTSVLVGAGLAAIASWIPAQGQMAHMDKGKRSPEPSVPLRITMDELHAQGGVPRNWKFSMPPGDAASGRQAFVTMECFACHEVKGEDFPHASRTPRGAGPELTGMGSHHPAEYFGESIMHPNRVIVLGPGYTGADGFSKMPSYEDTMTVKQLIDLVAYLESLTAENGHEHGKHVHGGAMEMKGPIKAH